MRAVRSRVAMPGQALGDLPAARDVLAQVLEVYPRTEAARLAGKRLERAIADVNADKTRWAGLLTERQLVPAPLIGSYEVPDFPPASVPSESQWADVVAWAQEQELITEQQRLQALDELETLTFQPMIIIKPFSINQGDITFAVLGDDLLRTGFDLLCQIRKIGASL